MAATCDGSIHVVGLEMDSRSITAHYGAIYLLHIDHQNILYSFGDDAILRSFTISKDGLLTAASSTAYSKKANMIFSVCGRTFLTFYE